MQKILIALATASLFAFPALAQEIRADYVARRGADVVTGFFEWSASAPVLYTNADPSGKGKVLWSIQGSISLNNEPLKSMSNVVLEVINDSLIDSPLTHPVVGDQITFFGTSQPTTGLTSVQNFYFRDESGLLLEKISQPNSQQQFEAFTSTRADIFFVNQTDPQSFHLESWKISSSVPEPGSIPLILAAFAMLLPRLSVKPNAEACQRSSQIPPA